MDRAAGPGPVPPAVVESAAMEVRPTEIQTERLRLRMWSPDDLDAYAPMVGDPDVMRHMATTLTPAQAEDQLLGFIRAWESGGVAHWAAEDRATGTLVGRIGLLHHDDWPHDPDTLEVGWLLASRFWGRGLATEGAWASLRYAFEELRAAEVISITLPANRRSRRVMERAGLTRAGHVRWRGHRHVWYAIDRGRWSERDRAPSPEGDV